MVLPNSNSTLSSLYSTGQCLLSVLGSVGVILLFAGIPQLIYSPHINPGSVMTFLLGAMLISLMVGGNAYIGYKYRILVRNRRQDGQGGTYESNQPVDDKPPTYDDILTEDGLPPNYSVLSFGKPPKYEDLPPGVFNWPMLKKNSSSCSLSSQNTTHCNPPSAPHTETPIIVPIQIHLGDPSENSSTTPRTSTSRDSNHDSKDSQSVIEEEKSTQVPAASTIPSNSSQLSLKSLIQTVVNYSQRFKDVTRSGSSSTNTSTNTQTNTSSSEGNNSQDNQNIPSVQVVNERAQLTVNRSNSLMLASVQENSVPSDQNNREALLSYQGNGENQNASTM